MNTAFTNDEMNLMCIYNRDGSRKGMISALKAMRQYLGEDDEELQALTDSYRKLYDQLMPEGQKRLTAQQDSRSRDSADPEEELHTAALMNKFDEMTRFLDRFM